MRGILLFNSRNELVFGNGDRDFQSHVNERIEKEFYMSTDNASTSSGVFSDDGSEATGVKNARRLTVRTESPKLNRLRETSHLFLPLVSLYRASVGLGDAFETSFSTTSKVRFTGLQNGYLMLSVCDGESHWDSRWIKNVSSVLQVNYGPLIDCVDTGLSVFDAAKGNLDRTISTMGTNENINTQDFLDIKASSFYQLQTQKVYPIARSLCDQLRMFMGANRCILMCHGEIIASVNSSSDDKKIWKYLNFEDLQTVQKHLKEKPLGPGTEVSQFWLRSHCGKMPYYIDVIRTRLTDHLELVCLSEAKNSIAIRMATIAMERLDSLIHEDIERADVDDAIRALAEVIEKLIQPRNQSKTPTAFMRNPKKTSDFILSLWDRLSGEIENYCIHSGLSSGNSTPRAIVNKRFSLATLRSTLSMISISTSVHSQSTCTGRNKQVPVKIETMIRFLRRQIQGLLQEMCAFGQNEATADKLNIFHSAMSTLYKPSHASTLRNMKIGDRHKQQELQSYLKPASLRCDMLAYSFGLNSNKMHIDHIPDEYQHIFDEYAGTDDDLVKFVNFTYKERSYYVIKLKSTATRSKKSWFRKKQEQPMSDLPSDCSITVLYNSFVHRQLAHNQTKMLAFHLHELASKSIKLFC